jgi:hypothetical protein
VAAAAIDALEEANAKKAMEEAKRFENEKNMDIVASVADVYSKEGDSSYQTYFENKLHQAIGLSKYAVFFYYANFLTRMDKAMALTGIKTIEQEGIASNSHFLTGAAKGALSRISKTFEDKKRKAQSDMAGESGKEARLASQGEIDGYGQIVNEAKGALDILDKKGAKGEE